MCGFLAIADARGLTEQAAQAALDSLALRGPDDRGSCTLPLPEGGDLFLGHRRLSILGLGEQGRQPYRVGRVNLVFNGEIYNYLELRTELEAQGVRFHSDTDTEVLAAGLDREGVAFIERLNGMFAGVAHFEDSGELLLFRDPAGQKPLYLHRSEGLLLAASEPKAILRYRNLEVHRGKLLRGFLLGYHNEGTIHAGIESLPPGHIAQLKNGFSEPAIRPYQTRADAPQETVCEQAFEEALSQAAERHLRSDVPLGLYLSGGIDSTLILHVLHGLGITPQCFTIGFAEASADETPWAKRAADHYGAPLTTQLVDVPEFDQVTGILDYFDEPFYDSSAIPTALLNQLAAEHVTVVLGGDGGDELFCGYRRYVHTLELQGYNQNALQRGLVDLVRRVGPSRLRRNKFLANASYSPVEALFRNSHDLSLLKYVREPDEVYRETLDSYTRAFPTSGPLTPESLFRGDVPNYLASDILTKADRCSMMTSIEQRAPLLDSQLILMGQRLPLQAKVRRKEGKLLLKRILERQLGRDFAFRRKQGFVFPLRRLLIHHEDPIKETLRAGLDPDLVDPESLLSSPFEDLSQERLSHAWRMFVLARYQVAA